MQYAHSRLANVPLPQPSDMFVRMLDCSPLGSPPPLYCVLELGEFTLGELVRHCKDMEVDGHKHSLSWEGGEPVRVVRDTLRGLAYLSGQLFVHGDLKPANLMWFGEGWKLIDLDGILTSSQLVDMHEADFYTALYAAPEIASAVAQGGPLRVSRSMDVWALGVMVSEMRILESPLWWKYSAVCEAADSEDPERGLIDFMSWLADSPEPIPPPSGAGDDPLLNLAYETMLLRDAGRRWSPTALLPAVNKLMTPGIIPPPTLNPPT
eukprot:Hpha_TRINITY_DN1995_c0_g2::TRINITY_DN1995_c0_g2_i1::g.31101::m.31101